MLVFAEHTLGGCRGVISMLIALMLVAGFINAIPIASESFQRYLALQRMYSISGKFHINVLDALQRLHGAYLTGKRKYDRDTIKGALEKAAGADSLEPNELYIYRGLLNLTDATEDHCSFELVELYESALAHLLKPPKDFKSVVDFSDFIRGYGEQKFRICATRDKADFEKQPRGHEQLNEVFWRALDKESPCVKEDLVEKLSKFDIMQDGFDKRLMSRAARQRVKNLVKPIDDFSADIVFMTDACKEIEAELPERRRVVRVISLERYLNNELTYPIDMNLEKEYHRLCLSWSTQQRLFADHVKEQLLHGYQMETAPLPKPETSKWSQAASWLGKVCGWNWISSP